MYLVPTEYAMSSTDEYVPMYLLHNIYENEHEVLQNFRYEMGYTTLCRLITRMNKYMRRGFKTECNIKNIELYIVKKEKELNMLKSL